MEEKYIDVHFKSPSDFRRRIAGLWQKQKENEVYNFTFEDAETEKAFDDLSKCFNSSEPF